MNYTPFVKMSAKTDELVALRDIARLANARPSTVSNWRKRYDTFPREIRRDGRQILFAREEVVRWLEQHGPSSPRWARPEEIRELVDEHDASEVALALLCLTSSVPDKVASIAAAEAPVDRVRRLAELSSATERELATPDLFIALREPGSGVDYDTFSFAVNRELVQFARDGRTGLSRQLAVDRFEHQLARLNQTRSRRLAETRSPRWLADLMVGLAEADHGLVLDPAAGEAGFLIAAGQAAAEPIELCGWEPNPATLRIARQRLIVHDLAATVEQFDSLGDSTLTPLRASAVISDPPLGLRERPDRWSAADPRWVYGLPAPHADLAWVQLALFHLAQGGRAAILTGQGPLFRSGYEARIRAELLEARVVEAVIGLPSGSALYTAIPLALWLLRKPVGGPTDDSVLFVDASTSANPDARLEGSEQSLDRLDTPQLTALAARIEHTVLAWREDPRSADLPAGFAHAHSCDVLRAGEANLSPARLVHLPTSHPEIVEATHVALEQHAELRAHLAALRALEVPNLPSTEKRRSTKLGELLETGRLDLISGRRGESTTDPPGVAVLGPWSFRGEPPRYDDTGTHRPWLRPGDVILRPSRGGFRAFVNDIPEAALEAPLQAIRLNAPAAADTPYLDPALLAEMVNIQKVAPTGTAGRYSVKNIEVPLLDRSTGEEFARFLAELRREDELENDAARLRMRLRELLIAALTG